MTVDHPTGSSERDGLTRHHWNCFHVIGLSFHLSEDSPAPRCIRASLWLWRCIRPLWGQTQNTQLVRSEPRTWRRTAAGHLRLESTMVWYGDQTSIPPLSLSEYFVEPEGRQTERASRFPPRRLSLMKTANIKVHYGKYSSPFKTLKVCCSSDLERFL